MGARVKIRPWLSPFLIGLCTSSVVSTVGTAWLGLPSSPWSLVVVLILGGAVLLVLDRIYGRSGE